jgi:hypothetical protein
MEPVTARIGGSRIALKAFLSYSRCPGRSALQFRSEPNQVVNYVNVVKRICETYAELKNSRP